MTAPPLTQSVALFVLLEHLFVASAYVAIAVWAIPKFRLPAPKFAHRLFIVVASIFFTFCAWTHVHDGYHAWLDRPYWMGGWHYLAQHVIQGWCGWMFVYLASKYVTIRIFQADKTLDQEMLAYVEQRMQEMK